VVFSSSSYKIEFDYLQIAHAAEIKSLKNETESTVAPLEKEKDVLESNTASFKELTVKKNDDMFSICAETTYGAIEHASCARLTLSIDATSRAFKLFAAKYFPNVEIEAIPGEAGRSAED
jgi:beta-xylosidase